MAGASDPLEDLLFSEVDEKAVSDLVGSLESQLVGQSEPPAARQSSAKQQQQTGGTAQLPAPVDSPSEPQQQAQQQENARKAARNPDSDPKDASMDKHAKALEKESPLKSHGSIIIITTAAAAAASDAPAPGNKGESPRDTRKKHPSNSRALRSAVSHSLNGNGGGAASTSASASSPSTSSTTITVSSNPQAIALDRGTPTIALHRLPHHIIASIAQNGNGTSVSSLVQQGARINHSKTPADNNAKPVVTSAPAAPVKPAASTAAVIRPAQTQTQPPAQQRVVTPQLIVRPPQQQTTIQLPPGFTIPPGTYDIQMCPAYSPLTLFHMLE